jgi:hypothetical protein
MTSRILLAAYIVDGIGIGSILEQSQAEALPLHRLLARLDKDGQAARCLVVDVGANRHHDLHALVVSIGRRG